MKTNWEYELENLTSAALEWGAHISGGKPGLDTLRLRARVLDAMRRYYAATMEKRRVEARRVTVCDCGNPASCKGARL